MKELSDFLNIDFSSFLVDSFIIILGIKTIWSLIEWLFSKCGIEFKWTRKKREDHDLLVATVQSLDALQRRHEADVEQSQKELNDAISILAKTGTSRDVQINALVNAQKEALADRINQKYKYYLSIKGIPEDEVDEFISLHTAYNGVGGNHNGDAKFNYCMEHLSIIPVEVKLKFDN